MPHIVLEKLKKEARTNILSSSMRPVFLAGLSSEKGVAGVPFFYFIISSISEKSKQRRSRRKLREKKQEEKRIGQDRI